MKLTRCIPFVFIPAILFMTNGFLLPAQETNDSLAYYYFDKAKAFRKKQSYDSAIYYYNKASQIFAARGIIAKNLESDLETAYIHSNLNDIATADSMLGLIMRRAPELGLDSSGILIGSYSLKARIAVSYPDFPVAIECMQKALNLSRLYYGDDHIKTASAYGDLGIVYNLAGQYEKTIYHCLKASEIIRQQYGEEHPLIAAGYNTIGNVYLDMGKLDSAQIIHEKALAIRLKKLGKDHLNTAASYSNLGVVAYEKADYQKALSYEQSVYAIRKKVYGENHPLTAQCYNNFGAIYEVTGIYEKALANHLKALSIREDVLPVGHPDLAMSYMNLANVYRHFNEFGKALHYHERALNIYKSLYGDISADVAQVTNNIGDIYFKMKDYPSSVLKFLEAIRILKAAYPGYLHPSLAAYKNNLAEAYIATNQIDSALNQVSLAMDLNSRSILLDDELTDTIVMGQTDYIRSMAIKARIDYLKYRDHHGGTDALKHSALNYVKAIKYTRLLRSSFTTDETKQFLAEMTSDLYDEAVNTLYCLYKSLRDTSWLNILYEIMESGKCGILSESLNHRAALQVSGIADSLIIKERELNADIRFLLNKVSVSNDSISDHRTRLYQQLFSREKEYIELISFLSTHYPKFSKIKGTYHLPGNDQISLHLDDQTVLLSYAVADTSLFIQVMRKNNYQLVHVVIDSTFEHTISDYLKSIKTFDFNAYASGSDKLYNILIRPVEKYIEGKADLIIIPDKILLYLPFETICSDWDHTGNIDFTVAPYLVKKYCIHYHYSLATYYHALQKDALRGIHSEGFVGFAPVFRQDSLHGNTSKATLLAMMNDSVYDRSVSMNGETFNELIYSEKEVNQIVKLFTDNHLPAKGYVHSSASEANFRQESGKCRYLHISTHGMINEYYPDLSGLIFSPQLDSADRIQLNDSANFQQNDGILFASELYGLDLQANLAVLSACETGIGKLIKGEGVISMVRSFIYAGVPNIIFSLWKVNDQSTQKLMVDFYSHLLERFSYAKALQLSKIALIQQEMYAYPLFWGGFTLIGPD
ncbi:MAG: CHAT domain-containing protein [Bacteroidales bacterium]|nr:CHAT domain-containing protein [Bacteroidales bacterium]